MVKLPDEPMRQYFTLLTDLELNEVDRLLAPGINPRDSKEVLGKHVVREYHGEEAADRAAAEFRRRSARLDPDEIPEIAVDAGLVDPEGRIPAPKLIVAMGFETSGGNARRVIEQGGFNIGPNREVITDVKALIYAADGLIVRVGKRKIARVRLS